MSEQWPTSGSKESDAETDPGSSSLNGSDPGDTAVTPDEPVEGITASEVGEPVEAAAADATASAEAAPEPDAAEAADVDDGSAFVSEMVRAMQTTAGAERTRIGGETDRRRQAHIDDVRAREATQADRIRELAADDQKAIEAWADDETKRIQAERERRTTELNKDLETSLTLHHAEIDREIEAIETVIATYRVEVASYFDGFDHESDPVLIAQQAARRPVFTNLDAALASAVAGKDSTATQAVAVEGNVDPETVAQTDSDGTSAEEPSVDGALTETKEPDVIAVMAGSAHTEERETAPAESSTESPEPTSVEAEPVGAGSGASQSGSGSLINTVPVHRPMSWLRRDSNEGDRSNQ